MCELLKEFSMGARSIALIAILTLAILFGLLYVSDFLKTTILTKPTISQAQAVKTVADYLKGKVKGLQDVAFWSNKEPGYRHFYFHPTQTVTGFGWELPLVYVHPNGTEIFINQTTDTIGDICTYSKIQDRQCGFNQIVDATKGRLIYYVDTEVYSNYTFVDNRGLKLSCQMLPKFAVDATNGDIVFSSLPTSRDQQGDCLTNFSA